VGNVGNVSLVSLVSDISNVITPYVKHSSSPRSHSR
jgi:hypothetical protein